MILSDRDIKKAIANGRIKITPAPDFETQLDACTLDFKLGNEFRIFRRSRIPHIDVQDTGSKQATTETTIVLDGEPFVLHPGELAIATTLEWLEIADDLVGRIEGRSSLGRLGVVVHGTASIFHPGWRGRPVMELGNLGVVPVLLYPGMRICSFTFEELSGKAEVPYYKKHGNKYAGQKNPIASKLAEDIKKKKEKRKPQGARRARK